MDPKSAPSKGDASTTADEVGRRIAFESNGGLVSPFRPSPSSSVSRTSPPAALSSISPSGLPRVPELARLSLEHGPSQHLDHALSLLERPDGATEARTLLPGVNLHKHLGLPELSEGSMGPSDQGDAGLSVLKTPKGVSLGDAVASAATMSAELSLAASLPATSGDGYGPAPTDSEGVASTPGTPIAGAASAESQSSAKIEPQAKQTPWESLMAKLSRASLRSPTVRNLPAKRNTPAKLLIPDVLEMMTPEVPQHLAGDAATPLLATPGLSPLPPLTPGAPGSVPLEARVEAVTRLWPILAPFVPCMLREVVLGHNEIRGLVFPQVEKETAAQLQQTPEAASAIEERTTPSARAFNAVIAVADISGFTALTIAMSQEGPPGLELLAKFMNSYFAQIMDLVLAYGGDVSKFAGDALIMVFVPTPREGEASPEDFGLRKTVVRAAACMKEMVERFGFMKMQPNGDALPVARERVRRTGSRFVRAETLNRTTSGPPPRRPGKLRSGAPAAAAAFAYRLTEGRGGSSGGPQKATDTPAVEGRSMSSQSMDRDESMGIGSGRLPSMDSDSLQEIVAESRPRLERSASSGHISVQTVPEDTSERALRLRQIYEGCMNKIVEEFDQYTHKIRPPELPLATHVGMEPSMSYTASTALSTVVSMGNLERTAATGNASMLPVDRSGMTHAESSPEVNLTSKAEAPWTQALPEEEVKTGCEGCDAPRPGGSPAAAVEDMEPRSTSGLAQALSSLTTPFNRLATVGKALNRITSDTSSAPSEGPEAMSQVESRRLSALGNFAWNMGGLGRRSSAPNSPQHSPPESPRGKGQRPAEALPVEGRQPSYLVPLNVGAELLSLKVTLTAGRLSAFRVGGMMEPTDGNSTETARWEFFLADEHASEEGASPASKGPFSQLAATECMAQSGEIILSREAAELATPHVLGVPLAGGAVRLKGVRQDALSAWRPGEEGLLDVEELAKKENQDLADLTPAQRVEAYKVLRCHVPISVRQRVENGHIDSVNEFRVCTALFFGFPSLNRGAGLDSLQNTVCIMQARMHHDGSFLQMRCDEKGLVALCAFGLPGRAHEDCPRRAILAALAIVETLKEEGVEAVVGVTTGSLFCGVVGSQLRAEYTVYGNAINLAARLMVKAAGGLGEVLCDEPTRYLAGKCMLRPGVHAHFDPLQPLNVKGKTGTLTAFKVTLRSPMDGSHEGMSPLAPGALFPTSKVFHDFDEPGVPQALEIAVEKHPSILIGRDAELARIGSRLTSLVDGHGGGAIFVEGDTGMGKTRMAEEVAFHRCFAPLRHRCTVLLGTGRLRRQSEPFFPFRQVYRQAALADKERSLDRRRRQGLPLKVEDGSDPPTDLALRLRDRLPDYATWRPTLASALGLPATDLPCALVRGQCGEDLPTLSPGSSGLRTRGPESPGKRDVIRISSDASRPSPETTAQKRRAVSARNIDPGRPSDAQTSFSKIEEMSITLRAEKVRAMLVDLLREYAACYGPILVVLDDAHFFDSPSWRLLLGIQEELRNVVLCVIMLRPLIPYPIRQQISLTRSHSQGRGGGVGRHDTLQWNQGLPITWLEPRSPKQRSGPPQDGPDPAITKLLREYYAALLALGDTECLVLRGFTLTETQSYMDMMMDGAKTSLEAAQLFWGKSNGLPSFLHQVMVYMRHRVRQVYELGEPVPDAWSVVRGALTYVRSTVSIHSVVPARMDRLRPDEQLTLKVASVMGVTVDEELLRACHPKRPSARRIAADMRALRTAGFLSKDPGGAPGMWHWNDILARDAVYDVLPATQCAELHARLAAAMEAQERNGEHILPLSTIAFHWRASCQLHVATEWRWSRKAIATWEACAEACIRSGSWDEAHSMLSSALRVSYILEEASQQVEGLIPVPTWRMAKWERAIAAVCLYMADDMPKGLENALLHSLRALSWLGYPLPWSSQYEKETKGWKAVVRNARKWSYGFVAGRQHLFGDELDAKAVAAEVAVLGAINTEPEPEERAWEAVDLHTISVNFLPGPGGVSADVEREGIAALRLLGAAVLSLPNPDKPSVEYVLWTCRQFCRGKVPQSHPLRDTYVRMKAALGKARPSARASLVALRTFQATMSAAHRTGETILQGLVSNASSGVQQRRSSFAAIREER